MGNDSGVLSKKGGLRWSRTLDWVAYVAIGVTIVLLLWWGVRKGLIEDGKKAGEWMGTIVTSTGFATITFPFRGKKRRSSRVMAAYGGMVALRVSAYVTLFNIAGLARPVPYYLSLPAEIFVAEVILRGIDFRDGQGRTRRGREEEYRAADGERR